MGILIHDLYILEPSTPLPPQAQPPTTPKEPSQPRLPRPLQQLTQQPSSSSSRTNLEYEAAKEEVIALIAELRGTDHGLRRLNIVELSVLLRYYQVCGVLA